MCDVVPNGSALIPVPARACQALNRSIAMRSFTDRSSWPRCRLWRRSAMVGAQPGMVGAAVPGTIVMVGENLPTIERSNDFSKMFPNPANGLRQCQRDTVRLSIRNRRVGSRDMAVRRPAPVPIVPIVPIAPSQDAASSRAPIAAATVDAGSEGSRGSGSCIPLICRIVLKCFARNPFGFRRGSEGSGN